MYRRETTLGYFVHQGAGHGVCLARMHLSVRVEPAAIRADRHAVADALGGLILSYGFLDRGRAVESLRDLVRIGAYHTERLRLRLSRRRATAPQPPDHPREHSWTSSPPPACPPALSARGMELVERKGSGHPDTLADGVAEAISRAYSRYCLDRFGAILHHNTDKTALLGGAAEVRFGHGEMTAPILVLVNGRITAALGDQTIPVTDIVTTAVHDYLAQALPLLDVDRWVRVQQRLTHASSPGGVVGTTSDQQAGRQYWFAPRSLDDLAERRRMFANDTSAGVGYAPLGIGRAARRRRGDRS